MKCYHCGQEVSNDAEFCTNCGAGLGSGATTVLDQSFNPYAQQESNAGYEAQSYATVNNYSTVNNYAVADNYNYAPSALMLPTNRGLLKMILFGILTLGIYPLVVYSKMVTEINIAASRSDGRVTMPYTAMMMLAPVTFGIYPLVWAHKFCSRIGNELQRRQLPYSFSASAFWLWGVLGSLIIVGPFVFIHKLLKAVNMINAEFNMGR